MNYKKVVITILLAFAAVPGFVLGQNAFVEFIAGPPCMVPVFVTDFAFPPEGGKIVRIGNKMYFIADYLPECKDAGAEGTVIRTANQPPVHIPLPSTGGGGFINFIAGDPCMVPVFVTDFAFPPEGGKIVRIGNKMYFIADYLPGCENAGAGGTVIRTADQAPFPTTPATTGGGSFVNFIAGDPCMVPVFVTDFKFPEEGGKILRIGSRMYFIADYIPGCEHAGAGGTVIRAE